MCQSFITWNNKLVTNMWTFREWFKVSGFVHCSRLFRRTNNWWEDVIKFCWIVQRRWQFDFIKYLLWASRGFMLLTCPCVCACVWVCQRRHSLASLPSHSSFHPCDAMLAQLLAMVLCLLQIGSSVKMAERIELGFVAWELPSILHCVKRKFGYLQK